MLLNTLHLPANIYAKKKIYKLIWEVFLIYRFILDTLFFCIPFHSEIYLKELSKAKYIGLPSIEFLLIPEYESTWYCFIMAFHGHVGYFLSSVIIDSVGINKLVP